MPTKQKLSPVKQQIITIERPFGGWVPQNNQFGAAPTVPIQGALDATGAVKTNQYSLSSFIDLFRANFIGHIAPAAVLNTLLPDAGNKVNQIPVAATTLELNYAVLANNRVVQFNLSGVGQINFWDIILAQLTASAKHTGHAVQTANAQNKDILSIIDTKVTPNLGYRFYTWEDDTDADIGIITQAISGGAFTQTIDWFSSLAGATLQKGVPLKLCKGTDGNIYCLNGQYLAQANIVGTSLASATCNAQKLNFGNGYVANSHVAYSNFHVTIGNFVTDSYADSQYPRVRVWFWNYGDANPSYVFDLNDFNADAVSVDESGTLRAITHGRDSLTRIWLYNGSAFQEEFAYPSAQISNPQHNQIDYVNGILHFIGAANLSINQWTGKGFHNTGSYGAYSAMGFLKNLDNVYIGLDAGAGVYRIATFNDNGSPPTVTYAQNATFKDQLRVLGYHGRVVAIKLYFSQFGTGASFKVSIFKGQDTVTDLVNRTITFSSGNNYDSVVIPMNVVLDSFWVQFLFNHSSITAIAAILRKAEIVVEPTDFKL